MQGPPSSRRDRGEATVQLVILTPILVVLVFFGVQAAIVFHAANVATAAAARGAAAGSAAPGGPANAIAAAQQTINDLGGHAVGSPRASESNGYIVVTVDVAVPRIIPFFPTAVSRSAREPKERFVAESRR